MLQLIQNEVIHASSSKGNNYLPKNVCCVQLEHLYAFITLGATAMLDMLFIIYAF